MRNSPAYVSGVMDLYKAVQDTTQDFPLEKLEDQEMRVWYNEIAIFDRLRFAMEEAGKEVTMKVRIPQFRTIDSHWYCKIDGHFHRVFNAAHIINKDGFPETELTLIRPENNLEVIDE